MPAIASRDQARAFIAGLVTREPRPETGRDKQIRSIGTERDYTIASTTAVDWLKANTNTTFLKQMTRGQATRFLEARSLLVGQKALDRDRTILDRLPRVRTPLKRIESHIPAGRLATKSRAYEGDQVEEIATRQNAGAALSTRLAYRCGLRSHELLTLKRADRLTKAERRELKGNGKWDSNRLKGRDGVRYVVRGKGGMLRVVIVPRDLARELECRYVPDGFKTQDRRIYYTQFYRISGGQKWSSSFSTASKRAFGWSLGGHACRHTFAQDRLSEYRDAGLTHVDALELVSQDLGHFRPRITKVYLR